MPITGRKPRNEASEASPDDLECVYLRVVDVDGQGGQGGLVSGGTLSPGSCEPPRAAQVPLSGQSMYDEVELFLTEATPQVLEQVEQARRTHQTLLDHGHRSIATGQLLRIALVGTHSRLVNAGQPRPLRVRNGLARPRPRRRRPHRMRCRRWETRPPAHVRRCRLPAHHAATATPVAATTHTRRRDRTAGVAGTPWEASPCPAGRQADAAAHGAGRRPPGCRGRGEQTRGG